MRLGEKETHWIFRHPDHRILQRKVEVDRTFGRQTPDLLPSPLWIAMGSDSSCPGNVDDIGEQVGLKSWGSKHSTTIDLIGYMSNFPDYMIQNECFHLGRLFLGSWSKVQRLAIFYWIILNPVNIYDHLSHKIMVPTENGRIIKAMVVRTQWIFRAQPCKTIGGAHLRIPYSSKSSGHAWATYTWESSKTRSQWVLQLPNNGFSLSCEKEISFFPQNFIAKRDLTAQDFRFLSFLFFPCLLDGWVVHIVVTCETFFLPTHLSLAN